MTYPQGGLLNPPRKRSNSAVIAVLLVIGIGSLVAAKYAFEAQKPASAPDSAAAQVAASEVPTVTITPRPTYNFVIDTVQAGQLEVIAQEKLNLAAAGTLEAERVNQGMRHAQELHEVKLTQQSIIHTFALTSTQQANAIQIAVVLEAAEDDKRTVRAWNDLLMIFAFVGFALACTMFWIAFLAIVRRIISAWDEAGQPEPVRPEAWEIHRDGNIQRPLAGDVCTNEQLQIIARVAMGEDGLTIEALEKAGLPSEKWSDRKNKDGIKILGIRSKMVHRGLVEITNPESTRPRAEPTPDGEALFAKVLEIQEG